MIYFADIDSTNKFNRTSFIIQDKKMILFMILTLTFTNGGHGGPVPKVSGSLLDPPKTPNVCPLQKVKEDFDISKVLLRSNLKTIIFIIVKFGKSKQLIFFDLIVFRRVVRS